jgi:hypothetical protein
MSQNSVLADCHTLWQLYKEENIMDNRLQRLYYDALQICVMHSDEARVRVIAQCCPEARKVCEGDDSSDVKGMIQYAEKPSIYCSFGASTMWKQAVDAVPKDLDVE